MSFWELLQESLGMLTLNKTRTGLAILGIVIGIASVITLISLGQSSQKAIQSQIQSLGSNLLTVMPGSTRQGAVRGALGGATTLTFEDAQAISNSTDVTSVQLVSPEYNRRAQISTGKNNSNSQIVGCTQNYLEVHKVNIDVGNFFGQSEVQNMGRVAIVGPTTAINLFGDVTSALGQNIRINGQSLVIIGVTRAKGGTGFQNQDDVVYVPLTTAMKLLFGSNNLSSIALEAKSADLMTTAQNEVGYLLLARHKFNDPSQADFSIFSQQDILNTAGSTTQTFTTLLSGVAAISLVVGGIGIMNIMLVTVTERTREIGLRKALGAKKVIITTQFLVESILLTFTGGMIGIAFGILASFVYAKLTGSIFVVSPTSVLLAFAVSVIIGLVFGYYPAKRAANLQPIEALRYE